MSAEGDVDFLVREKFFPSNFKGVMVEVGAARPDFLSIGRSFRDADWRVVSVEPNPNFAQRHRDLGNEIYEYACADFDRDNVDFHILTALGDMEFMGGQVTQESFSALEVRGDYAALLEKLQDRFKSQTIKVDVKRLETILSDIAKAPSVDVLAIDVEGWEIECLKGLGKYQPRVAIVENLFQKDALPNYMASQNYSLWQRLEPNDIYVTNQFA